MARAASSLPETKLRVVTLLVLLAVPLLAVPALVYFAVVVGALDYGSRVWVAALSFPVSVLLFVLALVLVVMRRWTPRAASTLLALSLTWFVLTLGLGLAFSGTDFTELAFEAPGLIRCIPVRRVAGL